MGRGKKYTDYYKEMISDLSSEYGITKSTIAGWVKDNSKIKVSEDEFMTMKEIAKIKDENEILKKLWPYLRKKNR